MVGERVAATGRGDWRGMVSRRKKEVREEKKEHWFIGGGKEG